MSTGCKYMDGTRGSGFVYVFGLGWGGVGGVG